MRALSNLAAYGELTRRQVCRAESSTPYPSVRVVYYQIGEGESGLRRRH